MRRSTETVVFDRSANVERIPAGTVHEIPRGTEAQITQALGGSFTLLIEGQLVRLKGVDADAIGKVQVNPTGPPNDDVEATLEEQVWSAMKTCYDPEIPINIVELGLIYSCQIEATEDGSSNVSIDMTLTAPGCGMGNAIADEVCEKIMAVPKVDEVRVNLVFYPPWDRSRMSEGALLSLGL